MSAYLQRRYIVSAVGLAGVYILVLAIGLQLHVNTVRGKNGKHGNSRELWTKPTVDGIEDPRVKTSVVRGEALFTETPLYAAEYVRAKLSCTSCHTEGGIRSFASPVVGIPPLFPMFSPRAGHEITLKDRIQECIVRSENGDPIAYDDPDMNAIVAYIEWLSQPNPMRQPFTGRGLVTLPKLKPDASHGAEVYSEQCSGCHGVTGAGQPYVIPPLWGEDSFNDGAGMNGVAKMAAFVQHNMPKNRMGILTAQDAYDVSAFIHKQRRPHFNVAYSIY